MQVVLEVFATVNTATQWELFFSVYNAQQKKCITEEFTISVPGNNTRQKNMTIFKVEQALVALTDEFQNLDLREMSPEVFLMCRLVKVVPDADDKKAGPKKGPVTFTRRLNIILFRE